MPKVRILSREEILQVNDLPEEIVPIPEWGEDAGVLVRGMSAAQRYEWLTNARGPDGKIDDQKALMQAVLMGVAEPQFGPEDLAILEQKSPTALDRISKVWLRLSGIGEERVIEARKNS